MNEPIKPAWGKTHCPLCERRFATTAEWESIPDGEGEHLCWSDPDLEDCQTAEFSPYKTLCGVLEEFYPPPEDDTQPRKGT